MKPENNACTGASSAVEFSLFMYLGCHCRGQPCLGRAGATCWWAPTALALLSQVASPTEEVVGPFSTAHSPSAFQNTTGLFRVRKLKEKINGKQKCYFVNQVCSLLLFLRLVSTSSQSMTRTTSQPPARPSWLIWTNTSRRSATRSTEARQR